MPNFTRPDICGNPFDSVMSLKTFLVQASKFCLSAGIRRVIRRGEQILRKAETGLRAAGVPPPERSGGGGGRPVAYRIGPCVTKRLHRSDEWNFPPTKDGFPSRRESNLRSLSRSKTSRQGRPLFSRWERSASSAQWRRRRLRVPADDGGQRLRSSRWPRQFRDGLFGGG